MWDGLRTKVVLATSFSRIVYLVIYLPRFCSMPLLAARQLTGIKKDALKPGTNVY
jgi:hypothetical protein